jgi:ABC-type branched-subunit amino acid transport system ATPase component/branched-subunit amino acid ABC-type transport system permease component
MKLFLQFVVIGLGSGAIYALFAQGAVLIYRGSGLVNFAQGAIGTLAAYIAFVELQLKHGWSTLPATVVGVAVAIAVAFAFQAIVLRKLKRAAAIVRVISTTALLGLLQAVVEKRYGAQNRSVNQFLPDDTFDIGGVKVSEARIYLVVISIAITLALWAWTRSTRTGLAISASAENERAVMTLGWSPDRLSALTWALGGGLAGLAAVLATPLTGLSTTTNTIVVTVAGLGAALLGRFSSFPLTFVGGLVIGLSESLATLYKGDIEDFLGQDQITGLNRAPAFIVILIVLVVRGRGLPLRSHVADRLPRLGTGVPNWKGLAIAVAILAFLILAVVGDSWAQAFYVSFTAGVMILSIVVITGFAGQLSLGQWALAGIGTLIAGRLVVDGGLPVELAIVLGIVLTIPVSLLFALPALRTRGVNLAVVTLGLGYVVSEVVFANASYLGPPIDGGTKVGTFDLFGIDVHASQHKERWAIVCLIALILVGLLVANLRRSTTGLRLVAVRTNERAAASLGVSVFAVKLYAFAVASGIAAVAGILVGFSSLNIQYSGFNVFASINSVGFAVIGGLGYVLASAFAAPNAIGGVGTRIIEDWLHLGGKWDLIIGSLLVFVILILQQDGIAAAATEHSRSLLEKVKLAGRRPEASALPEATTETVTPKSLDVAGLTVRFGGVVAVNDVSFQVNPGEVVGLIGPNGAGKTTIIDAVTGFVRPSAGTLTLDGAEVGKLNAGRRARLGLRRSFQSLELFEDLTVEANIRAGADKAKRSSWLIDLVWPKQEALTSEAIAAIREFALADDLIKLPPELPYGRRRLVGIARAVASGPSIIMLDEPAAGLDEAESRELAKLIRRLAVEWGMGVLLVEHDVGLVMSTCDRIVVIDFGRVIASGTPKEIRGDAAVKAAYLGHDTDDTDDSHDTAASAVGGGPVDSEVAP